MNNQAFDYSKLKGRIKEKCGTCFNFAKSLGCSSNTLSAKINNASDFSQTEIIKSVDILGLKKEDISTYFFTPKVQFSKHLTQQKTEQSAFLFSFCLNLFTQSFLQVFTIYQCTIYFYEKCCHFSSFSSAEMPICWQHFRNTC